GEEGVGWEGVAGGWEVGPAVRGPVRGVAGRPPGALVRFHPRAAAIFALGDYSLESSIFERVILGAHGKPFLCRIEAWPLGDGPALQHAVMLEPKVVMRAPRHVLLNDETVASRLLAFRRWLGRTLEVALCPVLGKQV